MIPFRILLCVMLTWAAIWQYYVGYMKKAMTLPKTGPTK